MGNGDTKLACGPCAPREGHEAAEVVECRLAPTKPAMASSCAHSSSALADSATHTTPLLYIERNASVPHSSVSTADGQSSKHSDLTSGTRTKTMQMMQTAGLGVVAVPAQKLDKNRLNFFVDRLHKSGIDTSRWGYGGAKSIEHLFWETFEQRGCVIIGDTALKRVTRLVKIKLLAEIFGVDHCLYSRMQFMHDGQTVERKQVPLRKLVWKDVDNLAKEMTDDFSAEECRHTEDWRLGARKTLEERLGLSQAWQAQHLAEDKEVYVYFVEDDVKSDGYPGLNTMYCIHEVTLRVRDPEHVGVQVIGLPEGQEFATAEGDFNFNHQQQDNGLPIGTQLNIWTWSRSVVIPRVTKESSMARVTTVRKVEEARLIRRVPLPTSSAQILASMQHRLSQPLPKAPPSAILWAAMDNLKTDWSLAKKIAQRMTDPQYSLKQFNLDLACFPELNMYLLDERASGGRATITSKSQTSASMSSGRTFGDEFQRTIGAFYAIYWLMRLDLDGKDGFSNGVDDEWKPIVCEDPDDLRVTQGEKRMNFKKNARWSFFHKLLFDAGLIEEKKHSILFKTVTKTQVNEKRLVSLLALTAFHDIMKMSMILPEVQKEHEKYHGYAAGDTIGDHDHALSYVMEHYPHLLPSFRELDPAERRSVQFTQCNLCFNHGWFVQAEAPPGAIFTKFREALIRDHKSQIGQRDVALYFVHWLTDLAGAEPTPLSGCEKFVTKFPLPVLNSFLRSFEFVGKIADSTETEVMEEYLQMRWVENTPPVGSLPKGGSAIAKMRLLCMAQMNGPAILKAFDVLSPDDSEILALEMSRTGCVGQSFSNDLVPKDARTRLEGPAFLIYYGPAFLQNLGNDCPARRLAVLAEIYRCAREMWPASIAKTSNNVTVRIDVIKSLSFANMQEALQEGDIWMLVKHNETEAFVERSSKRKLNKMISTSSIFQVLDLRAAEAHAADCVARK